MHTHPCPYPYALAPVRLYTLSVCVQLCCRLSRIRSERLQCLVGGLLLAHTVITWPYSELSRFNTFSVRLSPGDWRVMILRVLGCFCWQVITYVLVLGRFLRVDLKPISLSVCPSVHKKFFSDLNEIWYIGRGWWVIHDCMPNVLFKGQVRAGLMAEFKVCLLSQSNH